MSFWYKKRHNYFEVDIKDAFLRQNEKAVFLENSLNKLKSLPHFTIKQPVNRYF